MMTIWQDNVDAFTQRRDETGHRIDLERHATIAATVDDLVDDSPGRALHTLSRGVRRQWLLAGVGELQLGPEAKPSEILEAWDRQPRARSYEVLIWPRIPTGGAQ